jgi:MFS family permease
MSVIVFALRDLTAVLFAAFFLGVFGYLYMPTINVILYEVVPPETRSTATAADIFFVSTFSAITSFTIGSVSTYVGIQQGLDVGNLRVGFQGAVTVLLSGGILFTLILARIVRADMAALREYVARRAVAEIEEA